MGRSVTGARRRHRLIVAVGVTVAVVPALGRSSPPERVESTAQLGVVQSGRATAVSLRSLVGDVTLADTADVDDPAASPVTRRVVSLPGPLVSGSLVEGSVVIPALGSVRSHASVTDLRVDLVGGPGVTPPTAGPGAALVSIRLRAVTATAEASCAGGSSGQVRIGAIFVNDVAVTTGEVPGPNTRVRVGQLPSLSVVLNEQVPVTGDAGSGLTVNAVRITLAGVVDLVVSSARSEVGGCPPAQVAPEPPVAEVRPDIVRAGRVAIASAGRFAPSDVVQLTFDGPDLRPLEAVAGPDGTVAVAVVVPRDARLGARTLTAASGDRSTTATFLVVAAPAGPPAPPFRAEPG